MSDIRFNISGSSAPFIAQLYCGSTIIQQKAIEYSGSICNSCNILGNLIPGSCYSLKITDSIGNYINTGFTTPVQVGTTTLSTKNIGLAGTVNNGIPYTSYFTDYLTISPSLSAGETLTLNFTTCTVGGGSTGVNSNVSILRCPIGGSWGVVANISNAGTSILSPIVLNSGDKLCYNLNTVNNTTLSNGVPPINLCGCAVLTLTSASGNGFNLGNCSPNQVSTSVSYTTTTTTTTTTLPPISVYIGDIVNESLTSGNICISGKICTSPPLTAGQGFRLCYTTSARSSTFTGVDKPVSAMACLFRGTCACTRLGYGEIATNTCGYYCYIDVNLWNIGNMSVCVKALSSIVNNDSTFVNCGKVVLNTISNTCGGNFILSPNQCVYALSLSLLDDGGGGGGEIEK